MIPEELKPGLEQIFTHYGRPAQEAKLEEELSELLAALAWGDQGEIEEEMADVLVVLFGLIHNRKAEGRILKTARFKIKRQLKRIANEGGGK